MSRAVRSPLYSPLLRPTALAAEMMRRGTNALTFGVTLSSVVGGLPASGSGIVTINQVAPVNAITPVIAVSRSTGVAPLAVTFDALGTTAPALTSLPFSEIYYAWTFGDPAGGATWAYGTRPGVNLKNEANGPVAAHVFETHGSYTATCWAFYLDSGGTLHSGSSTTSITVTNPDTVFSGTNTICISQNSLPVQGVNGVPATAAVQQVADWATVETLAQTYKRILLKRGDTWAVTSSMDFDQVSRTGEGIIGAYGAGAKPILNLTYDGSILRTSAVCDDWRFVDLKMTCDGIGRKENGRSFNLVDSTDLLLLRCEADGAYFGITSSGNQGLYIVDSVMGQLETWVSGSGGYCIYNSSGQRLHIMGTQWGGATNHGCRLQGLRKSSIDCCTGTGNIPGNAAGAVFTLRGWIPWSVSDWTENVVVSRNSFAGNNNNLATISCSPMNTTSSEALRNVILDGNYITSTTSNVMTCEVVTGFTVRNNIWFSGATSSVDVRGQNTSGTPLPTQNFFYNNTFYCANAGGSLTAFYMYGTVSGIVFTNNIAYAPNITSTTFTNGTGGQVTLTNNSSDSQMRLNLPFVSATPAVAADFAPAGYAVNGGTWVPVYKNFMGTTNAAPREIGAI
jgi:hypothetical protein